MIMNIVKAVLRELRAIVEFPFVYRKLYNSAMYAFMRKR